MATTLENKIKSAKFVIILCIKEGILKSLQIVSKSLQSVNFGLERA